MPTKSRSRTLARVAVLALLSGGSLAISATTGTAAAAPVPACVPTTCISGTAVNAVTNEPAVGVRVRALLGTVSKFTTFTGADGAFQLPGLVNGQPYRVQFNDVNNTVARFELVDYGEAGTPVLVTPSATPLQARLTPYGTMTGTVVEKASGLPLANVRIRALVGTTEKRTVTTSATGTFVLPQLLAGNYSVQAADVAGGNKLFQPQWYVNATKAANATPVPTGTDISFEINGVKATDTDGDRLPDFAETGTGIYVSTSNTGTDKTKADTDGDAIKDGDEVRGTTAGLDLPAMGFSALHQDLAFEFDWVDDSTECGPHSHRMDADTVAKLTAAWAAGTNVNPDGTTGVHFIPDYGQGGAFTGGNLATGLPNGNIDGDFTPEFFTLKNANFAANRNGYFRYAILAHDESSFEGSAGVGEGGGDDMEVTLGCAYYVPGLLAGVLFHEGGHNLGLRHGGNDDDNNKPNYPSSMNYGMSDGPDINCDGVSDSSDGGGLGYSSGNEIDLDENALIEANGVCGPGHPIDWNKNGIIDPGPIAFNVNPGDGDQLSVLKDNDDWAQISFAGILDDD